MQKAKIMEKEVYDIIKKIPSGRLTTYGDIAKFLGKPNHGRTIGKILNKNENPINIPCHRVVQTNGKIGGYKFGEELKKVLLKREGIKINGNNIINFNEVREKLE